MSPAPAFEELRPGAFAVAYRMLGSVSEAEDVAQEALLRLHRAEHIESPAPTYRPLSPGWSRMLEEEEESRSLLIVPSGE